MMIAIFLAITLIAGVSAFAPTGHRAMSSKLFMGQAMKRAFDGSLIIPGAHPVQYALEHDDGSKALVRTHGCNAYSWIPAGGQEVFGKRADAVDITTDADPYAGGVPHCFPVFGPGSGNMPQHGFARGMEFTPEERAKKVSFDRMIYKLVPTDATRAVFDYDFEYRCDVTMRQNSMEWDVILLNKGDRPYDCNLGLHSYFDVSSLSNVVVEGPMGKITVNSPIDETFKGVSGPVTITDTGKGTKLTLESTGYTDLKIWNPYGDNSKGYDKFICVEPVVADKITIPVGQYKETKFYHKITYERL